MARKNIKVDFGYEADNTFKGSVFVIDSFENSLEVDLDRILKLLDKRDFDKVILYPLHENTLKRMKINVNNKYFSRLKILEDVLIDTKSLIQVNIDKLDGKRKKYTPIDFILNHLTEFHKKPHFVCFSKEVANKFAGFASFDDWIKKVRIMIVEDHSIELHPKLKENLKRIDFI